MVLNQFGMKKENNNKTKNKTEITAWISLQPGNCVSMYNVHIYFFSVSPILWIFTQLSAFGFYSLKFIIIEYLKPSFLWIVTMNGRATDSTTQHDLFFSFCHVFKKKICDIIRIVLTTFCRAMFCTLYTLRTEKNVIK